MQTFEIVLNTGLMMFVHKMVKVFVAGIGIGDDEAHATEKPIEFDRIVSVCKGLMEAFYKHRLLTQGGFWFAEFGADKMVMTMALVHCCECFVVAHELGHVVMRLSEGDVAEYAPARKLVEDFLQLIPELDKEQRGRLLGPWTEEICADLIGLQLSLAQPHINPFKTRRNHKQWLYGGAEISTILQVMLQKFYDKVYQGSKMTLVSTHPHSFLRLEAIRSSAERSGFSDDLKFGRRCAVFAQRVLTKLGCW